MFFFTNVDKMYRIKIRVKNGHLILITGAGILARANLLQILSLYCKKAFCDYWARCGDYSKYVRKYRILANRSRVSYTSWVSNTSCIANFKSSEYHLRVRPMTSRRFFPKTFHSLERGTLAYTISRVLIELGL